VPAPAASLDPSARWALAFAFPRAARPSFPRGQWERGRIRPRPAFTPKTAQQTRECGHHLLLDGVGEGIGLVAALQQQLEHRQRGLIAGLAVGRCLVLVLEAVAALGEQA